jgi:hypothetical protein
MGFVDSNNKVVPHNYFMFYVGDYDSAAWLYNIFKVHWDDSLRGQVPLGTNSKELREEACCIFTVMRFLSTEGGFSDDAFLF